MQRDAMLLAQYSGTAEHTQLIQTKQHHKDTADSSKQSSLLLEESPQG